MINNQYTQSVNNAIQQAIEIKALKDEWSLIKKGKYYSVSSRKYKDCQNKLLKVEGTLPTSYFTACQFYFDNIDTAFPKNRALCTGIDILEKVDNDTYVCVIKLAAMANSLPKEVLTVRHRKFISNNEILLVNGVLDEHQKLPRKQDVIRTEHAIYALYLTKLSATTTHFELYFLKDPSTSFPEQIFSKLSDVVLNSYEKDVETLTTKK
ncbi:hypothetical protein ABPG74_017318 [Tetrahymena malaccensis]